MRARQRSAEGGAVTRYEFLEFQKETARLIAEDMNHWRNSLERLIIQSEERSAKALEALEQRIKEDKKEAELRTEKFVLKSEDRIKEDREAAEKRQEAIEARLENERREAKRSTRWVIGTCVAVLTATVAVASAFFSFLATTIANGGFQF